MNPLNWRSPSMFSPYLAPIPLMARVRDYLAGGLLVLCVLAVYLGVPVVLAYFAARAFLA